jgi:hypothetical protein
MKLMRKRFAVALSVAIVIGGGFYVFQYLTADKIASVQYHTKEEASSIYVRFAMEAYDKIQANYWNGKPASTTERAQVLANVVKELKQATSSTAEKGVVVNVVASTLYNLEPIGRNGLMSQTQVTSLRNEVSNINPSKDLYSDLGLAKGAPVSDVNRAQERDFHRSQARACPGYLRAHSSF